MNLVERAPRASIKGVIGRHSSNSTGREETLRTMRAIHQRQRAAARVAVILGAALVFAGCASPEPVLYPNAHLRTVGDAQAERDVAECQELAEAAGASGAEGRGEAAAQGTVTGGAVGGASGAAGGAVIGSAGRGAAVGAASGATAGLLRSLFRSSGPSAAYRSFVDRCLAERGYEPVGWD
jgi:hypothetical protein